MRTLLRHTETGLYFQGPEKWTANVDTAYDFRFLDRAEQFIRNWGLEKVEVAFAFEDSQSLAATQLGQFELHHAA